LLANNRSFASHRGIRRTSVREQARSYKGSYSPQRLAQDETVLSAGTDCPLSLRERAGVRGMQGTDLPEHKQGFYIFTAVPLTLTISMLPFWPTTS